MSEPTGRNQNCVRYLESLGKINDNRIFGIVTPGLAAKVTYDDEQSYCKTGERREEALLILS